MTTKFHMSGWIVLAMTLAGVNPALAQTMTSGESVSGLIRITDNVQGKQIQVHNASQTTNCPSCQQNGGTVVNSGTTYSDSSYCPECQGRGRCFHGHLMGKLHGPHVSPGTGYVMPNRVPIYRNPVGYTQWYPSYWSGHGYGVPVPFNPAVAVPTDTTQLGYYYNHVPTWTPKPGMLPPIPRPDAWHVRSCNNGYHGGHGNCPPNGYVTGSGTVIENSNPADLQPMPEDPPLKTAPLKDAAPEPMASIVPHHAQQISYPLSQVQTADDVQTLFVIPTTEE
jgi:hypothetical protein